VNDSVAELWFLTAVVRVLKGFEQQRKFRASARESDCSAFAVKLSSSDWCHRS